MAKRDLLDADHRTPKKPERAALLLDFMIGRPRNRPQQNYLAWNRKHPSMKFKNRSDFKQALDRAVRLVLEPRYYMPFGKRINLLLGAWEELCREDG